MENVMNDDAPLPPSWRVTRAMSHTPAMSHTTTIHVGDRRLTDLARPGMRVTIVFTDATRACPDQHLVGGLLNELEACGIAPEHITLICATGLHRPSTPAERLAKLGPAIVARYYIVDHNALDPDGLVDLGVINGIPLVVNRQCIECDLLLATGVVEPHQYAGYSGGAKTVVIGCGGEATISATHGPVMLDHAGTRLGSIEGNPFQAFVRAGGERIGLRYVVNTILDETGEPLIIAAGPPVAVHDYLVAQARTIYETPVNHPVHVARAGVEGPKAVNLYRRVVQQPIWRWRNAPRFSLAHRSCYRRQYRKALARALANDGSSKRWHVLHRLTSFWKTCDGPAFLPERNAHTSWRRRWYAIRSSSSARSIPTSCAPAICALHPIWQPG